MLKLLNIYESNYIFIIAALTAIIDIVPVLGTGTVLLPWAAYNLLFGNFGMGVGLLVIYAAITVIRQIVEPKLVAGQVGLSPVVTVSALYLGLKVFGVLGMILGVPVCATAKMIIVDYIDNGKLDRSYEKKKYAF